MSRLLRGLWLEPDSWEAFEGWLADCFASLDVADVFEVGPAHYRPSDDDETVPCVQAVSLTRGRVLLRLASTPLVTPLLRSFEAVGVEPDIWRGSAGFDDGTQDWIVSADCAMLASVCVTWFRDRHGLDFRELGCDHEEAVDLLPGPLPLPKGCQLPGRPGHHGPGYFSGSIGGPEETWASVVEVDGEVIMLRMPDGRIARFRHHDPARFATAVHRPGGDVVAVRRTFLAVPNGRGHSLFSVAPDQGQPLDPCDADDAS